MSPVTNWTSPLCGGSKPSRGPEGRLIRVSVGNCMDNITRLIIDSEAHSGSWNMAADEVLLESVIDSGQCTVRVYKWETATISLGYFQDADDFRSSDRFRDLPAVRRLSGGGAILHHHELTYSLVLSGSHPGTRDPTAVYDLVHAAIIQQLASIGIEVAMRRTDRPQSDEPFLCFVRGDRHDILCCGHKIVGSAQRRRRGAVLQHGSLILNASPHATEIPGCLDLVSNVELPPDFDVTMGGAIASSLGGPLQLVDWSEHEIDTIRKHEQRYSTIDREKKSPGST